MDGLRGASVDSGAAHETLNTGVLGEGRSSAPRRYSGWVGGGRGGGEEEESEDVQRKLASSGPRRDWTGQRRGQLLRGPSWWEVERGGEG
jgi:hypothetical protein